MDVHRLYAGLQIQFNRVTVCLLMHDALPSYRHGVPLPNRKKENLKNAQSYLRQESRVFVAKFWKTSTHCVIFHPAILKPGSTQAPLTTTPLMQLSARSKKISIDFYAMSQATLSALKTHDLQKIKIWVK